MDRQTLQGFGFASCGGDHRRRVAGKAAYTGIVRTSAEQLLAVRSTRSGDDRLRRIKKPHEDREHDPVGHFVERIKEALVALVRCIGTKDVVGLAFHRSASRK